MKKAKRGAAPLSMSRAGLQERYHLAVDVGLGAGIRQGEAFGLTEEDFDAGIVHVPAAASPGREARPYFCLPKGEKTRTVPLSPNLARHARERFRRFPSIECTLPWRNPEAPETPSEARRRKPRDGEPRPSSRGGLAVNVIEC